jgi:hypothetical protein
MDSTAVGVCACERDRCERIDQLGADRRRQARCGGTVTLVSAGDLERSVG